MKNYYLFFCVLQLIIVFASVQSISAQTPTNEIKISGRLYDAASNTYLANKEVKCFRFDEPAYAVNFITNDSGYFEFKFGRSSLFFGSLYEITLRAEQPCGGIKDSTFSFNSDLVNTYSEILFLLCNNEYFTYNFCGAPIQNEDLGNNTYRFTVDNPFLEIGFDNINWYVNLVYQPTNFNQHHLDFEILPGQNYVIWAWVNGYQCASVLHFNSDPSTSPNASLCNFDFIINATEHPSKKTIQTSIPSLIPLNANFSWNMGDGTVYENTSIVTNHTYAEYGTYDVCLTTSIPGQCQQILCKQWEYAPLPDICNLDVHYSFITQQNFAIVVADLWPSNLNNLNKLYFYLNNELVDSSQTYAIIKIHKLGQNTICTRLIGPNCNLEQCQEYNFSPPAIPNPCEVTFSKTYHGWFNESVRFSIDKPSASYMWDFGDGQTSTAAEPFHTYEQEGIYQVCLTTQFGACNFNYCDTVQISSEQTCRNAFRNKIISKNTVDFSVLMPQQNLDPPAMIHWNFGDGQSSNDKRVIHHFDNSVIYNVCMNLEIPGRCSVMECRNINLQDYTSSLSGQVENHFQLPDITSSKIVLYEYVFDYNQYAQPFQANYSYSVVARDTVQPFANGNYSFDSIPQGFYGLKFIPSELQISQNWVPSYREFTPFWIQSHFRNGFFYQENMTSNLRVVNFQNLNSSGTGTIGGHLVEGPFRMSADYFDDAGLMLFFNNKLVNFRYIADSETFLFDNLPFGIYTIVVDKTGFATQMKSVVLTPEQPDANVSINFYELNPYVLYNQDLLKDDPLHVFPNPSTDHIVIERLTNNSYLTIDFISSDGRVLKTIQSKANEFMSLDVSFVPSGLFFLRITDASGTRIKKLIKM